MRFHGFELDFRKSLSAGGRTSESGFGGCLRREPEESLSVFALALSVDKGA